MSVSVSAARMVSRFATPGLPTSSKVISRPESVTADLIFRMLILGSSSSSMIPPGEEADLLIFAVGSARSLILPTEADDVRLGDGEGRAVAGVEPGGQVPAQLEVLALVLPDRHLVGLVEQDVGGHQHRVGEQPDVGALRAHLGGLVLELGHPLGLPEPGQAAEDPAQLGVLGHVGLQEHGRPRPGRCRRRSAAPRCAATGRASVRRVRSRRSARAGRRRRRTPRGRPAAAPTAAAPPGSCRGAASRRWAGRGRAPAATRGGGRRTRGPFFHGADGPSGFRSAAGSGDSPDRLVEPVHDDRRRPGGRPAR